MCEIIRVDFKRRSRLVPNPLMERFREMLIRLGLGYDDIESVFQSIESYESYQNANPTVKKCVDVFNQHTAQL